MIDFDSNPIFKLKKDSTIRKEEIAPLLIAGENVIGSYTSNRDYVVFTDKRIISVNVKGMSGKKRDYTSLPYSNIAVFSVETAGVLDLDSELELYFAGVGKVHFDFSGASDIVAIGQAISGFALK